MRKLTAPWKTKVFGYWRPSVDSLVDLPFPIAASEDFPNKKEIMNKLDLVEAKTPTMGFMGFSVSRLTGERVGNKEFFFYNKENNTLYSWPEGYRHYLNHNVPPDQDFIDFLNMALENEHSETF